MQELGAWEATRISREHFPFIIASTPPDAGQRKLVVVIIALLVLGIAIAIPFAGVQGPRIDAFIPVLQTVMCVADLITAILPLLNIQSSLGARFWSLQAATSAAGRLPSCKRSHFPERMPRQVSSAARITRLCFLCSGTPRFRWRSSSMHFRRM